MPQPTAIHEITLPWGGPLRLLRLGWFPLARHTSAIYQHPTWALHLHQYRGTVWIGGASFHLAPGDLTLTPPHTPSRYDLERAGQHWCVHFHPPATTAPSGLPLPLHHAAQRAQSHLEPRLAWLAEISRPCTPAPSPSEAAFAAEALETGVRELLLWLHFSARQPADAGDADQPPLRAERALRQLAELLERRYERDWSAKDIAAETGLNADYLARQFRRRFGCTIAQFLLRQRMEAARHLLRATTLRVKEIGAAVGIPDPQKFNKDFRRATGQSPQAYRLDATG